MKKLFTLFAAALVMLAAASCEKNEVLPDNNSEGKVVTLKASINNGGTKTSLGPGVQEGSNPIQYPVYWSEGDAIAVIQEDINSENYGSVYIFTLSEGGAGKASATFECNNAYGFDPDLEYRAVYPASSVVLSDGKFDGYSFSATQSYVQNSFGVGAMPMQTSMYIGTNTPLNFSNVFGVLKLQLKGAADEKVTSIVVTSDNALSGEAILYGAKIVLNGTAAENKKVTLDCSADGGVVLNPGTATDFHIALPAGVHKLSVCFVTNKGVYYKTTEQTIESGRIIKMASLDTENKGEPNSDFPNGNMSYVENGVYLGEGVALPAGEGKTIIWAPVNCGYDENHKGGLLYQWGRKYGQGYSNDVEDPDVSIVYARQTLAIGTDALYKNIFYTGDWNDCRGDWLVSGDRNPKLWNNGTEEVPKKNADYDPCPIGWRVPTYNELETLWNIASGSSSGNSKIVEMSSNKDGLNGFWARSDLFFSAFRFRNYNGDCPEVNNSTTYTSSAYWSSCAGDNVPAMSKCMFVNYGKYDSNYRKLTLDERSRACGYSVRCVKE